MVEPTDNGPITATVVVQVVPGPLGYADDDPARLTALAAPLPPRARAGADQPWREVTVVPVAGAGSAIRTCGIRDVDLPETGVTVRVMLMQTLVPLPHAGTLVLSCSSPVLQLAEDLLDLFDALNGTLRIAGLDDVPGVAEWPGWPW